MTVVALAYGHETDEGLADYPLAQVIDLDSRRRPRIQRRVYWEAAGSVNSMSLEDGGVVCYNPND